MKNKDNKSSFDTSNLTTAGLWLLMVFGANAVAILMQMPDRPNAGYYAVLCVSAFIANLGLLWLMLSMTLKLIKVNK